MKNILRILFIFLFFYNTVGQTVTNKEAQQIASIFFKNTLKSNNTNTKSEAHTNTSGDTLWYIFSSEQSYIIIAANKASIPIIGYSHTNPYDFDKELPPALNEWLNMRANELQYIINNNIKPTPEITNCWDMILENNILFSAHKSSKVEPLLVSQWNQDCFYNEACPEDDSGPCNRVYAGCVATSMAQVMYYYRYPKFGQNHSSYEHHIYGILSANYGETEYKWNEMRSNIIGSVPAIAELLYHAGVSVQMNYSPIGSGSTTEAIPYALTQYFKYSDEVDNKYRYFYKDEEWKNMLKENLNKGYPLIYAGRKEMFEGGHAFNCDGYDENDYFHFDFGWSGHYNGYFSINNLNPDVYNFNAAQTAVFNIVPRTMENNYCQGQTVLRADMGSFNDGSNVFSNYAPNSSCSWLIEPEIPVEHIVLDFVKFDVVDENDFVTIYDGPDSSFPIIGKYTGTSPPKIQGSGQSMLITFTSNNTIESKGWLAEYYVVPQKFCNLTELVSDLSGTITDGSGEYNYSNNTICRWNIMPAVGEQIFIEFTEFKTEAYYDVLKIIDLNSNSVIAEYSGHELPPSQIINSSKIRIQFITDDSTTDEGWSLNYSVVTSIDENNFKNKYNIYPNPSNEDLYVDIQNNTSEHALIQITDITYKLKYSQFHNAFESPISIDISTFPKGIYILSITNKETIFREKIIIQ